MLICLALLSETLHPTQFLLSLVCCVASVVRQPFSRLAGSVCFPAVAWLSAQHLAYFRQCRPAAQKLGKQQIQLCWPYLLSLVCRSSAPLPCFCLGSAGWKVLWTEADSHHIYTVLCEWRPEVGQYLWVPLWVLMMPKACADTWAIFIKCSWVCMWNKLDCCPYCTFCLNGFVHRWCNLGENAGSKVPAFNRIRTKDFTMLTFQGCWNISYAATTKAVSLMLCATFSLKWNESQM